MTQSDLQRTASRGWGATGLTVLLEKQSRTRGELSANLTTLAFDASDFHISYAVVWCRIQAMTADSARCSMGMRFVLATVPLPTGVE